MSGMISTDNLVKIELLIPKTTDDCINYYIRLSVAVSFLALTVKCKFAKKILENILILCNFV